MLRRPDRVHLPGYPGARASSIPRGGRIPVEVKPKTNKKLNAIYKEQRWTLSWLVSETKGDQPPVSDVMQPGGIHLFDMC